MKTNPNKVLIYVAAASLLALQAGGECLDTSDAPKGKGRASHIETERAHGRLVHKRLPEPSYLQIQHTQMARLGRT